MNRFIPRFRALFAFAFILLASACAGGPPAIQYSSDPSLGAWLSAREGGRGSLIDAVPLQRENTAAVLDVLRPEILGLQSNAAPIVEAGFFRRLEALKPSLFGVRTLRLHYWSADSRGRPIQLSGALYLPVAAGVIDVPLLLLCHGTQVLRDRVPSPLAGGERTVAIVLASSGVAVPLPD